MPPPHQPQMASPAARIANEPFSEKSWHIRTKTSDSLKPFTGRPEHYGDWAEQIRDHLNLCQSGWLRVLQVIEAGIEPITTATLVAWGKH